MPVRVERRTTEKASLSPTMPPRDERIPRVFDSAVESGNGPGAFAVFRRGSHLASTDVDTVWDPTEQEPERVPPPDELIQESDCDGGTETITMSAEVTLASDSSRNPKHVSHMKIFFALVVLVAGAVTAAMIMMSGSSAGEGISDDEEGEVSMYVLCSALDESTTQVSDVENYDALIEELGVDPVPPATSCTPTNEALLFVSQEYNATSSSKKSRLNRFVLSTLFLSTKGSEWSISTGWMTPESECNWYGVSCFDGSVTQIKLEFNRLSGSLPDEIGLLTSLEELTLPFNFLSGSIPSTVQHMTNLAWFNVSGNRFGGTPLPFLVQMTWLKELGLSGNDISGTIPHEVLNMTVLTHLALVAPNLLSGEIPSSLGDVSTMKTLEFGGSSLTGTLPDSLYKLTNLWRLRIDAATMLTGTLSTEVGELTNLRYLVVQGNGEMSGTIPSEIGRLTNLLGIGFDGQLNLAGTIPSEIALLTKLDYFSVLGTLISGTLPSDLSRINDLNSKQFPTLRVRSSEHAQKRVGKAWV